MVNNNNRNKKKKSEENRERLGNRYYRGGILGSANRRPFNDPNRNLDPTNLLGYNPDVSGQYYQLRLSDPIVSSAMNDLINFISSLDWEVREPENATPSEIAATNYVKSYFKSCDMNLSELIGAISDYYLTYGIYASEVVYKKHDYNGYKYKMVLYPLPPYSIKSVYPNPDGTPDYIIQRGSMSNNFHEPKIPYSKMIHIKNSDDDDVFFGSSVLRPLLFAKTFKEKMLKELLKRLSFENAIPIANEMNAEPQTEENINNLKEVLDSIVDGDISSLYMPYGIKLDSWQPATQSTDILKYLEYFDDQIRSVLYNSLDSLTKSNHGSWALSKEVNSEENKRKAQIVEHISKKINKNNGYDIISRILDLGSFYNVRRPEIYASDLYQADPKDLIQAAKEFMDIGGKLTQKDLQDIGNLLGFGKEFDDDEMNEMPDKDADGDRPYPQPNKMDDGLLGASRDESEGSNGVIND